jgi:hypothetical protein
LGTRSGIPLGFRLPTSGHPGDDDAAIICGYRVADPVKQHRGRIGRTVAVRAIGVENLDASVSECPEGVVGRVLIAGQSSALLHQEDARAVLQAEGQDLRETRTVSHGQRPRAILEHVADDRQVIRTGEAVASLPLSVGSRGSFLLGRRDPAIDNAAEWIERRKRIHRISPNGPQIRLIVRFLCSQRKRLVHKPSGVASRGVGCALDPHANIRSMPSYTFVVTEHDPERPWIVLGRERQSVMLDDDVLFAVWAHEQWPAPRWSVELDPWQLGGQWLSGRDR